MTAPEEPTGPVIRDNRRIDPVTGQPKRGKHAASQPAGTASAGRPGGAGSGNAGPGGAGSGGPGAAKRGAADEPQAAAAAPKPTATPADMPAAEPSSEATELRAQLAERTADLQRLQAEYANYRKRVDRDRATVREQAVASALTELLPVLDAINQAHEHGELSGGFKSVADSLQGAVGKLGLVSYGQRGDAFDPKIHEALSYSDSPDVTEDTCVEIFQPGYKVGERILRPARVAVAAPGSGPDGSENAAEWSTGEDNN
ncbi:MAG TPA: nucleotide exchange factor GrpE [Streptosporangiaceae bacterium]|nr:nucleotide exchange factor GrpE [Streptosporangiaceae bacterium]